ncbi:MAG: 5'/3'-nucleotidase SurE [Marinilabiliales bacterium]
MANKKPYILITNDDGIDALGIKTLIEIVSDIGEIVVIAPVKAESGKSHAITINKPIRLNLIEDKKNLKIFTATGTPVDCVKLALNQVLKKKPDYLFSGINHGSNSSVSAIYSGTIGAAVEGCLNGIPSAGFSLMSHKPDADFSAAKFYTEKIIKYLLENKPDDYTCLNVNIPYIKKEEIQGIKICTMTQGVWKEEYEKRIDPHNRPYYWLTGYFKNNEPDNELSDEWALNNNYVSVVPLQTDWTAYHQIDNLKDMEK